LVLQSLLYEITPADPATYSAAAASILLVALAACLIPAVRAVCMPPMAVLRSE
jgi:hypothetical protein